MTTIAPGFQRPEAQPSLQTSISLRKAFWTLRGDLRVSGWGALPQIFGSLGASWALTLYSWMLG